MAVNNNGNIMAATTVTNAIPKGNNKGGEEKLNFYLNISSLRIVGRSDGDTCFEF